MPERSGPVPSWFFISRKLTDKNQSFPVISVVD